MSLSKKISFIMNAIRESGNFNSLCNLDVLHEYNLHSNDHKDRGTDSNLQTNNMDTSDSFDSLKEVESRYYEYYKRKNSTNYSDAETDETEETNEGYNAKYPLYNASLMSSVSFICQNCNEKYDTCKKLTEHQIMRHSGN